MKKILVSHLIEVRAEATVEKSSRIASQAIFQQLAKLLKILISTNHNSNCGLVMSERGYRFEETVSCALSPEVAKSHVKFLVMGKSLKKLRKQTRRKIRRTKLNDELLKQLQENARYEGNPVHKRNPGDFNLDPPSAPRPEKTLCDEAEVFSLKEATTLLKKAIEVGLFSESETKSGLPKQIWVVRESDGQVFEAMNGGSRDESYHGYPIRKSDSLFGLITSEWRKRNERN